MLTVYLMKSAVTIFWYKNYEFLHKNYGFLYKNYGIFWYTYGFFGIHMDLLVYIWIFCIKIMDYLV